LDTCGGQHLEVKYIYNSGRAFLKANYDIKYNNNNNNKEEWEVQLREAISYIGEEGDWNYKEIYYIREFNSGVSHIIMFVKRSRINTLCRREYLTLLDSTHNFNILKWKLYGISRVYTSPVPTFFP
jgi:hypothetical protein